MEPQYFDTFSDFEMSLVDVLGDLEEQQIGHCMIVDSAMPDTPSFCQKRRLGVIRAHRLQMLRWIRHMRRHEPQVTLRQPMNLDSLWERTRTPRKLRPSRLTPNDLAFHRFNLSFRAQESGQWYFVAYPNSEFRFRAIALECSGRSFMTSGPLKHSVHPSSLDFSPVRLNTFRFDRRSRTRSIPSVRTVFLPESGSNWVKLNGRKQNPETVIIDELDGE